MNNASKKWNSLCVHQFPAGVEAEEDAQQDGETPERTAAIAEEGQGDADDRRQTQHHAHVDEDVEKEDAQHTVAIDAAELKRLSFSQMD